MSSASRGFPGVERDHIGAGRGGKWRVRGRAGTRRTAMTEMKYTAKSRLPRRALARSVTVGGNIGGAKSRDLAASAVHQPQFLKGGI